MALISRDKNYAVHVSISPSISLISYLRKKCFRFYQLLFISFSNKINPYSIYYIFNVQFVKLSVYLIYVMYV